MSAIVEGVLEEAKSVLATLINNIMSIIRMIVAWCMEFFNRIVDFAGQHPEAFLLTVGNLIIWVS